MKINWKRTIQNKFSHLLSLLIVLFLISPFLEENSLGSSILSFFLLLAIILTLRTVHVHRKLFIILSSLAGIAFLLDLILCCVPTSQIKDAFAILTLSTYIIFTGTAIVLLSRRMFAIRKVEGDTIKGGICIYLLIGFFWALLYYLVYALDNNAFYSQSGTVVKRLIYFSFTTITTLGYGDVYPVNNFGMVLASLEAIAGQMFIAVFIARLVALYTTQELKKDINQ